MKKLNISFYSIILLLSMTIQTANAQVDNNRRAFNRAEIHPTLVNLEPGAQQQFFIVLATTRLKAAYNPEKVTWSVNGIPGGNSTVGTISSDGIYSAPSTLKVSPEIMITGFVAEADNQVSTATVLFNGKRTQYTKAAEFSEQRSQLNHFKDPVSIAIEKNGNFLIADGKIHRYAASGKWMESFGEQKGDIIGHLYELLNVAVDNNGKIFASDQKITPPRIMAFNQQGKHLYSFGQKGYAPGMSFNTRGIAFDSRNRLYIGDMDLQRVTVFDNNGNYQFHFGSAGAGVLDFNGYYDLALDRNNDVFAVSYFGKCQKLDANGNYLMTFATPDPPYGIVYTTDVATDSRGNAYVVVHGPKNNEGEFTVAKDAQGKPMNIIKYSNNGDFISTITLSEGRTPINVAIDRQDRLVVLFKSDKEIGVEILKEVY